jgi:subfamily B ATP-binding cassette protein MsbA
VTQAPHAKPFEALRKNIRFHAVSFRYPQTQAQVLRNISFDVSVGSRVALVGHSGAGKSTLVDLIPRFYDVTEGKITFDGEDVRDLRIADLRRAIGVVTQEIFLFNGTVRQNIAYGRDDIAQEDIERAAELAYADVFIKNLPLRYETQIGERGLMLSGGQRQRISIARAILKDPQILILDEATSALDSESERLVQRALEKLMKNRTVFVIAHRLSTIYNADQILVMNKGRIVERGTHKELIKKKGHYKKLYDLQFRE